MYPLVSSVDPSKLSDMFFSSWVANFTDGIHDLVGYYTTQDHKGFDEDGDHFALWMIEVYHLVCQGICTKKFARALVTL